MLKWLIVLLLLFFDQAVKIVILNFLPQLVVFNQGIAFGFLPSDWWLAANLLIVLLVFFIWREVFPSSLIIAGGLSNILDRIFKGGVVDFIDLQFWPVFNLADLFICLGAVCFFLPGRPRQDLISNADA